MLSPEEQTHSLQALIERVLPEDENFDFAVQKVLQQIQSHAAANPDTFAQPLARWLTALNAESYAVFGQSFQSLHPGIRDELLDRIESQNYRTDWQLDPQELYNTLLEKIAQAYEMP